MHHTTDQDIAQALMGAAALLLTGALALTLGAGCVPAGEGTLLEVDPDAAPARPTYTEHVAPLMEHYCTACHAPDAQAGEQEGYGYETCSKVRSNWWPLVETTFEEKTMPPGGAERVTSAHQLTLERWFEQGAPCD